MDDIFGDMINGCIIIVYMDNIFLFAPDTATLTENTRKVLQCLRDNNLFLKPTKCEFNKIKIEYLGMIIEENKIFMDRKTCRNQRLAQTHHSQRNTEVLRIWKLLSQIHLTLLQPDETLK